MNDMTNNQKETMLSVEMQDVVQNEKKKPGIAVAGVVDKAAKTGKKGMELVAAGGKSLAEGIVVGAKSLSDKSKIENYNKRMKKYNPLFPEEYFSADFFVPNIICIVDDAVRRDVDVCKGAIGWRENKRGAEVLYLYDEFVEQSGLSFVPMVLCDEIYYIDSFDRKKFVKLDYIFQKSHEEKLAELEHIAYSLGAKSCVIEIEEKEVKRDKKKRSNETKESKDLMKVKESYESESSNDSSLKCTSKSETNFTGNNSVSMPKLKWFAHDNNILNLIDYRINSGNAITSKTLQLSGASSATMSRNAACSIDVAVSGMGIGQEYNMEDKSIRESTMRITYKVEF